VIRRNKADLVPKRKIIKKYDNRKLYDTSKSAYVTLGDVAIMVKNHEDIVVVENKTKNDITALTLMQIAFENERVAAEFMPVSTLQEIIKHGGTLSKFLLKFGLFTPEQLLNQRIYEKQDNTMASTDPQVFLNQMQTVTLDFTDTIAKPGNEKLTCDTLPIGFSS
jgi:polyhydroxyalkanoate synthesis repressor PhaR